MLTGSWPIPAAARADRVPRRVEAVPVTTLAAVEQLVPAWERLWAQSHASPFQSPAWLLPWWMHVGRGTLASVAFHCADTGLLVGLAPLYVYTQSGTGARHLFPLGIATTDRLDILALPGWTHAVAQALVAHCDTTATAWDVFEVPQLPDDARLLAAEWPARWHRELAPSDPNPVLPLPAAIPRSMAANLAYCRRRAARAGDVAYELADAGSLQDWLAILQRLHARRWALRDQPGVLRDESVLAWHRDAAPQLLRAGLLRLLGLRIAGRAVAALYVLADAAGVPQRRWSYYIGGFDPEAAALSPGTLLVGHAIEQAQAEGAQLFDFLRGAEPYKQRWGAVPRAMVNLRVHRA